MTTLAVPPSSPTMLCDLNAVRGFVDRLVTDDAPPVAPSSVPIPYATAGRSTPVQLGSAALSAAPALVYEDIIGSPHSSDGPATPPHRPYPTFPPIGFERDVLLRVAAIDAANQVSVDLHPRLQQQLTHVDRIACRRGPFPR